MRHLAIVGVLLLAAPGAAVAAAGAAVAEPIRVARVAAGTFSPNGDGVADTGAIRYYVPRTVDRLQLTISERDASYGEHLRVVDLGVADRGTYTWRWDGRDQRGRRVRDASYKVTLSHPGQWYVSGRIIVDTSFAPGLAITPGPEGGQPGTPSIYPRSTAVRDALDLSVLAGTGDRSMRRLRLTIRDPRGRAVLRRVQRDVRGDDDLLTERWTARLDGRALPAGRYRAVLTGVDRAGNRGRDVRPIWVSKERLTWQERTLAVQPQAVVQDRCAFYSIGNACGEGPPSCGEVAPSAVYSGGLSYRSHECSHGTSGASALHHVGVAEAAVRGVAAARVSFAGRPTTDGEADQGTLRVESRDGAEDVTVTASTSAESPWVECPLTCHGWWGDYGGEWLPPGVAWTFSTAGTDAVDVATFTVTLRYLAVAE